MMTDPPAPEPLDPQRAAHLTAFARGCSAAARAVSLYPAGHPAVDAALARLVETTGAITGVEPFRLTVLPQGLLLDGRGPATADQAVPELAGLLHQHLISGLILHDGGESTTWQTLLGLLGRPQDEIRDEGGISHLWSEQGGLTTEDQRRSIELREIDYERLLRNRSLGPPATLDQIFDSLSSGQTDGLDATARSTLGTIIRDPAKLERFAAELAERVAGVEGAHAESVLQLLRAATELLKEDDNEPRAGALTNLAQMLTGMSAETMADLLRRRGTPAAMVDSEDAVRTVTDRMASADVATFVSDSIVAEQGASHRLAEAFQALVPDLDERRQLVSLVGRKMAESPFGQTQAFPDIWKHAETLLTSYSDEEFVHDEYAHELNRARTQAIEVENVSDDPEERIAVWLATIDDTALRSLDLQLLLDLLALERDAFRWRDIAETVGGHIEGLTLSGDLDWALRLLDGIARERPDDSDGSDSGDNRDDAPSAPDSLPGFAVAAIDRLAVGPAVRHAIAQLRSGSATAVTQVKQLCDTLGPGIVVSLADVLATERDARVRRTVRDILVGFGARGRDAVRQLLNAPDWEVRQTAAFLLREFGGDEGLDELGHLLTDAEPLVQREAIRAMVRMGDERAYHVLAQVLAKSQSRQRTTLLQQLTSQRDERAVPLCRYLLTQVDHRTASDVFLAVIETLGAVGGEGAIEPLRDALYRGEWWAPFRTRALRRAAAQALRRTRMPAAAQVLRDAVAQGPWGARAVARTQLAQIEARQ
jgi:HEAT repeat protein